MKQLIMLLLALTMIMSLAACGGKPTTDNVPKTDTSATEKPASSAETKPPIDSATVQGTETPAENSTKLADPPTAEQMLADVCAYDYPLFVENGIQITSLELLLRQSNPEQKEDISICKLIEEIGPMRWEYQFKLRYDYYDQGGWNLEEMIPDREDLWTPIYHDAEGNDLMDDVIWLDERWCSTNGEFIGPLEPTSYPCYDNIDHLIGMNDGTAWIGYHFTLRDSYEEYFAVYDQHGTLLWVPLDENGYKANIQVVDVSPTGTPFVITCERIRDPQTMKVSYANYQLYSSSGPVGDTYDSISYFSEIDSYIIQKAGLFGIMDKSGVITSPISAETREEIPEYAAYLAAHTIDHSNASYKMIEKPESMGKTSMALNGVYVVHKDDGTYDVVDTASKTLLNNPHRTAFINNRAILAVYESRDNNGLFEGQYFTFSGRALSHRMQFFGNALPGSDIFVYKDGMIGILPTLLTDEEYDYFRYQWGWEHNNAQN